MCNHEPYIHPVPISLHFIASYRKYAYIFMRPFPRYHYLSRIKNALSILLGVY